MSLKPNEVNTENIVNGAVTTPKIADDAVTTAKIKNNAVTTDKLATGAVNGSKLADNAVTGSKIRDGTVRSEKIAPGAITQSKIGAQEVIGSRIKDKAITAEKLAANCVTTEKIANGAVTPAKLSFTPPSVTRPITPPLTSVELGNNAVTTEKIADGAVTEDKIAADAVTQSKIARNSVGWSEIKAQSLEPEQIKTLSGAPATEGQVPVADLSEDNQWWFRWADAATRPLTPPVTTAEIGDGQVTQQKLAPDVQTGDRFTFLMPSVDALYLTDISADIPYTPFDLSAYVPATAKAVLLQIGIFNQAYANGRVFFRMRTNETQRDAIGVGIAPGANSMTANQGIVPLLVGTPSIEYALESVGGPWTATFTLWITVVGYIV